MTDRVQLPVDSGNVPLDLFFCHRIIQGSVSMDGLVMDDWKKQLDLLIDQTLAFVRASKKIDFPQTAAPRESQGLARRPAPMQLPMRAEIPTPKDSLNMERDLIQRRVANFKVNQKKFQKDREEYFTRTMAEARATQRTPRSRDSDRSLMGPSS